MLLNEIDNCRIRTHYHRITSKIVRNLNNITLVITTQVTFCCYCINWVKVLQEKEIYQSYYMKILKGGLNLRQNPYSKATTTLTLGTTMKLVGKFLVLILWIKWKVCKHKSTINDNPQNCILHIWWLNELFIWLYLM